MSRIESPVPAPALDALPPEISREIYGMPAFATVMVADVNASVAWYTDALGFITLFTIPGHDGGPVLVHLRRWQFQDLLIRPAQGPVTVGSSVSLSFAAVYSEIDDLASRAAEHGGGTSQGPTDTPWNTRDLLTTDPDGNVVIFTAGRPPEAQDDGFVDRMHQWSDEQL
jgi:uncharacterized glyoxalase superfamily protein PhnB